MGIIAPAVTVQVLVTTSGSIQRAYCYFYGGTSGTIGLIALTPENVFDHEAGDIADFLNSVEISDQEFQSSDLAKAVSGTPLSAQQTAVGATNTPSAKLTKQEQQRLKREQEAAQRVAKAEKKKEEEARANLPTQPDVIEKCIAVRNIVFRPWRRGFFNPDASVSGVISNKCGKEVEVNISVTFYSSSGDSMDLAYVSKLVPIGDTPFWTSATRDSDATFLSKTAKITNVFVNLF
jgi:hypothetical protein